MKKILIASAVSAAALLASTSSFAQLTANATVTNNYIWRGLTQTMNEGAVQGGLKYTDKDSGAYVGTWISNVRFDAGDTYNYENDLFFGISGPIGDFTYDLGYLYYNYDHKAAADFGEVYAALTMGNLTLKANFLTNTQYVEPVGQDYGAFKTYYVSGDYAIPLASGAAVGLHVGYQDGDFSNAFNGVTKGYYDYNVSISKSGFAAMVSMTSLGADDNHDGVPDYASMPPRSNDEVKFIVSYTLNFDL